MIFIDLKIEFLWEDFLNIYILFQHNLDKNSVKIIFNEFAIGIFNDFSLLRFFSLDSKDRVQKREFTCLSVTGYQVPRNYGTLYHITVTQLIRFPKLLG